MTKQYAERDAMALDEAGGYYMRHVMAMTGEKLHGKGDIAAELGWRDMQIAALQQKLDAVQEEIARRDAIFIPVYPDENLMNKLTDVFHDTAKIHCDEDGVFVNNAELVITAVINNYLQSPDRNQLRAGSKEGGV
ncbi:hypothetical protein K5Y32_07380 [Pantoea sp. DY-15]|uniref:hypothetical protein n=1 Tax=Pantoea sp. DY-15 TaxID=2871489 RepID=UPI001C93C93F|nr:hypothetical protein [Pantoea sp. DY-15]MBY4887754.1 hypothetical protein [Pantoea sp. DY-15]